MMPEGAGYGKKKRPIKKKPTKKKKVKKKITDKELLNMHTKKLGSKANVSNKANKPKKK